MSIITINGLKSNEKLVKITDKNISRGFWMIGKYNYKQKDNHDISDRFNQWDKFGIDFIEELIKMTKAEQKVVNMMKDCYKWNTDERYYEMEVEISEEKETAEFNAGISHKTFLKAFGLLREKDLMCRTKKNHYMLNPEFILPSKRREYYDSLWSRRKTKQK